MALTSPSGIFAPFRSRDYRYLWPSDLLTSWAFEMEFIVLAWYVLVTTESVFWLSVLQALHYGGTLLAPAFGVIGDTIGLRNLLCLMRATYAVLAGALAFLFLTDNATLPVIFGVAALLGAIRPSDLGIRSALVAQTVPPQGLNGALAIARTTVDSARIVGALSGAALFGAIGIGNTYSAIAGFYFASLAFTMLISRPPRIVTGQRSPLRDLAEGASYIWRTSHVQAGMWLALLVNFTAFPLSIGLPPYVAREIYGLDQSGLGWMIASFAIGSLVGSVALAVLRDNVPTGRLMMIAAAFWHLCLLAYVHSPTSEMAMVMLGGAGLAQGLSMLSLSAMLLRTSEPAMRGRVMGVRMLAIYTLPVGMLIAGVMIPRLGYHTTATVFVVAGLVLTIVITLRWYSDVWSMSGRTNQRQ